MRSQFLVFFFLTSEPLRPPNSSLCLAHNHYKYQHILSVSKHALLNIFHWIFTPQWIAKSILMHQFSLTGFTNISRIYKTIIVIIRKAHTDVFLCSRRKQLFVEFKLVKSSLTYRLWTSSYWHAQYVSTVPVVFHSFKAY